ncbi:MAG: hypothetical protein HKN43_13450 [Rhodothermales bacterium]|nr:hypothetical protein [Rhodothermales bacterium]
MPRTPLAKSFYMHEIILVILVSGLALGGCTDDVHQSSVKHGEPGVRPFWNVHSGRYIYAPTIAWEDPPGTSSEYLIQVNDLSLETDEPWVNLTEIWDDLAEGNVTIYIRGLSDSGETSFADTISTIKSPGFDEAMVESYENPADDGMLGLESVLVLDKVQHWIDPGGPFPDYPLWVHPSKLMGVLSQGMLFLSQNSEDPDVQSQAKDIAVRSAQFLLALREPEGAPLAGWTHSYWDGVDRGDHPIYMDQIMTLYPSEAALAFLDLFDATADSIWFDSAVDIARTYAATHRADGTWYLLLKREDGSPHRDKLLVPVSVISFLDRLKTQYGIDAFVDVRERAFDWIMENPVNTYAWEAQFEDTRPKRRYRNLSHREAANFARLLFETSDDPADMRLAGELLLFVEDQFVIWDHSDAVTQKNWFREGMKWNGNRTDGTPGKDWFLPAALEQYAFYTPIAGTTSNVIHAYCAGFEATGETVYRDKARALTLSLVEAREYHSSGEIPTHLRKDLPEENWLNNSVYSARTLVDASCL